MLVDKLKLSQMASGAFEEQIGIELDKVLHNIKDANTDPKKARKITITITLKPDEKRELVGFEVQSKAALVPPKPLSTTIMVDRDSKGAVVAAELKSGVKGQTFLDKDGEIKDDKGNVLNINRGRS